MKAYLFVFLLATICSADPCAFGKCVYPSTCVDGICIEEENTNLAAEIAADLLESRSESEPTENSYLKAELEVEALVRKMQKPNPCALGQCVYPSTCVDGKCLRVENPDLAAQKAAALLQGRGDSDYLKAELKVQDLVQEMQKPNPCALGQCVYPSTCVDGKCITVENPDIEAQEAMNTLIKAADSNEICGLTKCVWPAVCIDGECMLEEPIEEPKED